MKFSEDETPVPGESYPCDLAVVQLVLKLWLVSCSQVSDWDSPGTQQRRPKWIHSHPNVRDRCVPCARAAIFKRKRQEQMTQVLS